MWMMLRAQPRPCFNHELIDEIMTLARAAKDSGLPIDFWVTGSLVPQIYNVGGDLNFFAEAIRTGRREALRAYARACVDCVHAATRGFDTGAVSLAMIEGTALGGGFEAALAHHFVLAQNNARMGFPEMAFNLFPGMGGYSLVARRSGMKLAEELIGSGESHTAEWFQARPSAADYASVPSGASNLAPSNPALAARIAEDAQRWQAEGQGAVPMELVTTSASGLDPHLSPAAARYQVARIAAARGLPASRLEQLIEQHVQAPLVGPAVVNVLALNLALADNPFLAPTK